MGPGPEGANGRKKEAPNSRWLRSRELVVMRVEEITLHENGFPETGRLGDPIGGFFLEG
jgi:hypothetical protein